MPRHSHRAGAGAWSRRARNRHPILPLPADPIVQHAQAGAGQRRGAARRAGSRTGATTGAGEGLGGGAASRRTKRGRLAAREQVSAAYVTRVVRLAFLAPAVTQAISRRAAARRGHGGKAYARRPIPANWGTQAAALLPA